ncbi:MAG: hypothetical protein J6A69_02265 [Clostridia bacterium]|nr:hypothetical protein [Clostridia bacterium]
MKKDTNKREIFLVLTQTGTVLSRLLKLVTGAEFNHSSISIKDDLSVMYSFGRLRPYNPFRGGFVREAPHIGTFLRFSDTEAVVVSLSVTEKQYREIKKHLSAMYRNKQIYKYNYMGLVFAMFGKGCAMKNSYYCSEFVKDVLVRFDVVSEDLFLEVVKPIDIYNAVNGRVVYRGKLKNYERVAM